MDFKIDFLCVGFFKAGTTSLCSALENHKEILLANVKETYYLKWYKKYSNPLNRLKCLFFPNYDKNKVTGSFEPASYRFAYDAYEQFGSDTKIIFIIRNPIDAVYSYSKMNLRNIYKENTLTYYKKYKKLDNVLKNYIENFLKEESTETYKYDKWISEYIKYFGKNNVHVIIFEELIKNPDEVLNNLEDFLGIEKIPLKLEHKNKGDKIAKNYICAYISYLLCKTREKLKSRPKWLRDKVSVIYFYINKIILTNTTYKMDDELKEKIYNFYLESIKNTEKIIDKDLSIWKNFNG
jgi:hypothetical protein